METPDLKEIAKRLSEKMADRDFQREFLNDPVSVLKGEGLKLSSDQEKAIAEYIRKIEPNVEPVNATVVPVPNIIPVPDQEPPA